MKYHAKIIRIFIFIIPLVSGGVWGESVNALGKSGKGGIALSHLGPHNSQARPLHPSIRGIAPQAKAPKVLHKMLKVPQKKLSLRERSFNLSQPHSLFPYYFSPSTPEHSDPTPSLLAQDSQAPEALIKENPRRPEASHPLVIELRCGKFVRIPWPESSLLYNYEEGQEEQCADSK